MNGQFLQESFNSLKLARFADVLARHGFDLSVQWKNGSKKVDAPDGGTNSFELKYKGKLLLCQNRNLGSVNMSQLDASERLVLLRELRAYNFYTKPAWTLGLGLVALYAGLVALIASLQGESGMNGLGVILLVLLVFTLVLLGATYYWSAGKLSEKSYPYFYPFGIGYLFTAPSSLLALPLFQQCLRFYLYRQVTDERAAATGAAAGA